MVPMRSLNAVAGVWLLGAIEQAAAGNGCSRHDLQRARQRVPRDGWRGGDFGGMASVLSSHLERSGFAVQPCEHWTVDGLQRLQARLFREADSRLLEVYKAAKDNRRQRFNSYEEMKAHWATLDRAVTNSTELNTVRRDGLCHETVMWWVHHLPVATQKALTAEGLSLPSLPRHLHRQATLGASDAEKVFSEYAQQVSCQQCHTGRLSGDLTNATLPPPPPVDREHPGLERKRVCDFQNQPACGPCDGLGGVRRGDGVEEMVPMLCEVLHGPEVPATTKGRYPSLAIVNLTGDSRSPLAVIPDGKGTYHKLNARLALGWKDGMMRMRYDFNGLGTQLSVQSFQQAEHMNPGATAFWTSSGRCSCQASMAGNMHVRSFEADDPLDPLKLPPSQGGAAYLGRVRVTLDYNMSRSNGTVIADHFMKWAFHFLVDADSSSPSFGLPLRLYGPYGVLQVFDSWKLGDPAVADPDIWKMPAGCNISAPVCSILETKDVMEKVLVV
mmetsp:Transcript_215/g.473  ORF Transcript_215/g.473 Transcript_215/m.473 type:complete len:499 (-) Transcript_215:141-1637(-)